MKKILILLILTVATLTSSAFAQRQVLSDDHTVTVKVPRVLRLAVDDSDVVFDFTVTDNAAAEFDGFLQAGLDNYISFLERAPGTQHFAPTSYGGSDTEFVSATVVTNQSSWVLSIDSVGTFGNLLDGRLKVEVDDSGNYVVAEARDLAAGKQGKSAFELRYALALRTTDTFDTAVSDTITVTYKVAAQ